MKDFFISYNDDDQGWAKWIARTLEEAGYLVVLQTWNFTRGQDFSLDMNRAVAETQTTIAVLSETFLRSDYTAPEWAAAFVHDSRNLKRKLMPVRVGVCQPTGLLAQIAYVDLVRVPEAEALQRLLNALKERAKPDQKPSFPGTVLPKAERKKPQPLAFPREKRTTTGAQLKLSTFEFDVATVSLKKLKRLLGLLPTQVKLTSRRRQAQYFTEDLGNGVGLDMVSIPGGQFFMGAPETEAESLDSERPQHLVRVNPFFMGKYLVTQEQWLMVSELPKVNRKLHPNCSWFKEVKCPVERVSWWEAVEFCDRLSAYTGRHYHLPSEAEWEYACRAGTTTPFHFGETLTTDLANYNGSTTYGAGPKGNKRLPRTDVDRFPPNAFGLYDMHGNVWEWCLDHWHDNYQGAPTDGSAWAEGGNPERRVRRGGSWILFPGLCRSASRTYSSTDFRYTHIGFRVVCAAP